MSSSMYVAVQVTIVARLARLRDGQRHGLFISSYRTHILHRYHFQISCLAPNASSQWSDILPFVRQVAEPLCSFITAFCRKECRLYETVLNDPVDMQHVTT